MTNDAQILVVEDSPTQAERLRQLLEAQGYPVQLARNGREALAALRERAPALVVTDVVMPEMDGYELCAAINADSALADVPVILLTSLADPQDVIRSLQCGADNFIRKPYEARYLLSRISNILTSRELRLSGKLQVGLEVYLAGEKHFISAERQQILDFLLSTYEEVAQINRELAEANAELQARQEELERERARVQELADVKRAILDATADGIALVDPQGRTVLRNAALERLVAEIPGAEAGAPLGENLVAAAPHVADPEAHRAFITSLIEDPSRTGSFDLELPDAGKFLHIYSAPVAEGDELRGRIFVVRDVTRERAADRLKSELVATVSHELRTPLTAILGFAELAAASRDPDTTREHLEIVTREARRLGDLVSTFLDLNRMEEGAFEFEREHVDLGSILREQMEVFAVQSDAHPVALDLPDEQLPVIGDRARLAQVVANLLSNAIKYSPGGGAVEVAGRLVGDSVEVSVTDHGLGIPEAQLGQLFTKFVRVDTPERRSIGGTGLGLALSREIVGLHGGRIDVESVEGEGSTFRFRIPAAA